MSSRRAVWLPTPTQLLLLRASLWEGGRAKAAWLEWRRAEPNLDAVDAGSSRLLPLAYRNLGPLLAGDPDSARLKDAYRRSWTFNQIGLRVACRAIDALQAAGVEVLALKGAALLGSAYRDAGARPMGDVDLAVRENRVAEAVGALRAAGMTPIEENPERLLAVRHSIAFRDETGYEVDLHGRALWRPGLDSAFWDGSIEGEVAGARVRILNPADQLLHVCAHGAAWNPVHPVRWAADAFKTIEAADEELDWERLTSMAREGHLALPLSQALELLAEDLEAPVPAAPRSRLAAVPVSRRERRAHNALAQPPSWRRSLTMLSWFWERYRAQAAAEGERPGPLSFARYMRGFWGLDKSSEVPAHALRRVLRQRS